MKIFWEEVRDKRNRKLKDCDWTQMPDCQLSAEKKAEWATYRQALRDIPNNLRNHQNYISDEESHPYNGSIMDWHFPTKPED